MAERSMHLKLQEYLACYLEADQRNELERISREGTASDITGDPQEVALKFLALAILYGINEKARTIKLVRKNKDEITLKVKTGEEKVKLPPPPPELCDQVFEVMQAITHLDGAKKPEPLVLGLQNDSIELSVSFESKEEERSLKIKFPEL